MALMAALKSGSLCLLQLPANTHIHSPADRFFNSLFPVFIKALCTRQLTQIWTKTKKNNNITSSSLFLSLSIVSVDTTGLCCIRLTIGVSGCWLALHGRCSMRCGCGSDDAIVLLCLSTAARNIMKYLSFENGNEKEIYPFFIVGHEFCSFSFSYRFYSFVLLDTPF